jgi:hypothetical protein
MLFAGAASIVTEVVAIQPLASVTYCSYKFQQLNQ